MENDLIGKLFSHMDELRHLPDYQLERRAEILFYLFVPWILEYKFKVAFKEPIIPEFPVKIDIIDKDRAGSNHSIKIDYFAITDESDAERAFLIELKTDSSSIKSEQNSNLLETCRNSLFVLLDGVIKIAPNSHKERKYLYLISRLTELDLFDEMPDELEKIRNNVTLHGMKSALDKIVIRSDLKLLKPEPVYILPNDMVEIDGVIIITFRDIREALEKLRHPLAKRFALSLTSWDEIEAGKIKAGQFLTD